MGVNGVGDEVTLDCTGCKKPFSIKLPKVEVINNPVVSMAVAPHERLSKCPNCGASFLFFIDRVQTSWSISPVSEVQRQQIEGSNLIQLNDRI